MIKATTVVLCASLLATFGVTAAQDSVSQPSTGSASVRKGKSPYATETGFTKPPVVYVVPMNGQMGTDIHKSIYERMLKEIKEVKPDMIVFRLNSHDGKFTTTWMEGIEQQMRDDKVDERRIASCVEEFRDLADKLHTELDGMPSVMYVEDARGMASMFALAWPYMFMAPTGYIQGLDTVAGLTWGNDVDIRAKMFAAWTGIAKGVLELGGHPQELSDALVRPDRQLSVDVDGRTTKWRGDSEGTWYLVDDNMERPAMFSAKSAEDTGLSDGIVSDVNDLMLLLGYPEAKVIDTGEKMHADYVTKWRKVYKDTEEWMADFRDPARNLADLGKKKTTLEKMLQTFKQYPAVARLWEWKYGLTASQIEMFLERLTEQMRQARKAQEQQKGKGGSGGGKGKGFGGLG